MISARVIPRYLFETLALRQIEARPLLCEGY